MTAPKVNPQGKDWHWECLTLTESFRFTALSLKAAELMSAALDGREWPVTPYLRLTLFAGYDPLQTAGGKKGVSVDLSVAIWLLTKEKLS